MILKASWFFLYYFILLWRKRFLLETYLILSHALFMKVLLKNPVFKILDFARVPKFRPRTKQEYHRKFIYKSFKVFHAILVLELLNLDFVQGLPNLEMKPLILEHFLHYVHVTAECFCIQNIVAVRMINTFFKGN